MRTLIASLISRSPVAVHTALFNDDDFMLSPRHFTAMRGLMDEFGLRMTFQTRSSDIIRHQRLLAESRGSIAQVHVGIESFSDSQLSRWSKGCDARINLQALALLSSLGLSYYPYIILSDHLTSPAEMAATCRALAVLPPCPFSPGAPALSPLYWGLSLNRMKGFTGEALTSPATAYLERVWTFIGQTRPALRRVQALVRHTTARRLDSASLISLIDGWLFTVTRMAEQPDDTAARDFITAAEHAEFNALPQWLPELESA